MDTYIILTWANYYQYQSFLERYYILEFKFTVSCVFSLHFYNFSNLEKGKQNLKLNFFTHLQHLASASKMYSLKWNCYLLKFRSSAEVLVKKKKYAVIQYDLAYTVYCNCLAKCDLASANFESCMWTYYQKNKFTIISFMWFPSTYRWTHEIPKWSNTQEQCQSSLSQFPRGSQRVYQDRMPGEHWRPIAAYPSHNWYLDNNHCDERRATELADAVAYFMSATRFRGLQHMWGEYTSGVCLEKIGSWGTSSWEILSFWLQREILLHRIKKYIKKKVTTD